MSSEREIVKEYAIKYYECEERSSKRNIIVKELAEILKIEQDKVRRMINNMNRTEHFSHPNVEKAVERKETSENEEKRKELSKINAIIESLPNQKVFNGHIYTLNKKISSARSAYYYCKCKCSLIISTDGTNTFTKVSGEHNPECPIIFTENETEKNFEIELHKKMCEICNQEKPFRDCYTEIYKWIQNQTILVDKKNGSFLTKEN